MNDDLDKLLSEKGFQLSGESNTGKTVKKFEKEEISKKLFTVLSSDQVYRLISFFLFNKSVMTVDNLVREITKSKNLAYTLEGSIVKKAICKKCHREIFFGRNDPSPNIPCQKCGRKDFKIVDDWDLKIDIYRIITSYLGKLETEGLVGKILEFNCPLCFTNSEYSDDKKIKTSEGRISLLSCERCKSIREIRWVYTPPEIVSNLWISNGVWLEWYVKSLLESYSIKVAQGMNVRNKKTNTHSEVDGLVVQGNKIISISCRVASINNTYNEEPDISKLFPFSDYVIFVTTTKVTESIKERYNEIKPECKKIFIDGKDIEKIPEIIKKLN